MWWHGLMNMPEDQFFQCGLAIVIADSLPSWRHTLREDVEKRIKSQVGSMGVTLSFTTLNTETSVEMIKVLMSAFF